MSSLWCWTVSCCSCSNAISICHFCILYLCTFIHMTYHNNTFWMLNKFAHTSHSCTHALTAYRQPLLLLPVTLLCLPNDLLFPGLQDHHCPYHCQQSNSASKLRWAWSFHRTHSHLVCWLWNGFKCLSWLVGGENTMDVEWCMCWKVRWRRGFTIRVHPCLQLLTGSHYPTDCIGGFITVSLIWWALTWNCLPQFPCVNIM